VGVALRLCEGEVAGEEVGIAPGPRFAAGLAAHPAFLLQEVQEDEAAEQALHEVADGFVGLVLVGF
jgi:hypothetical protein